MKDENDDIMKNVKVRPRTPHYFRNNNLVDEEGKD